MQRWRELCGLVGVVFGPVAEPPPLPSTVVSAGSFVRKVTPPVESVFMSEVTAPMATNFTASNIIPSSPGSSDTSTEITTSGDEFFTPEFGFHDEDIDPNLFSMLTTPFIVDSCGDESQIFGTPVLQDRQILPTEWQKDLHMWEHGLENPHESTLLEDLFWEGSYNGLQNNFSNTADCIGY